MFGVNIIAQRDVTIRINVGGDYSANLQKFNAALSKAEQNTKFLGQASEKNVSSFDKLSKSINAFLGLAAIQRAGQLVGEMVNLGNEANATEARFRNLSSTMGDYDTVMKGLREATLNIVDDMHLQAGAMLLMQTAGIKTSDELERMMNIITLSKKPSEDMTTAINNFGLMLANNSILRLDSFGISASAVRERIIELQASGEALDRSSAFRMAVMEEAEKNIGRLGEAADAAATPLSRLQTKIDNVFQDIGQKVAEGAQGFALFFDYLDAVAKHNAEMEALAMGPQPSQLPVPLTPEQIQANIAAMKEASDAEIELISQRVQGLASLANVRDVMHDYGELFRDPEYTTSEVAERLREAADEAERLAEEMGKAAEENPDLFSEDQVELAKQTAEEADKLASAAEKAADAWNNISLAEMLGQKDGGTLAEEFDAVVDALERMGVAEAELANAQRAFDLRTGEQSWASLAFNDQIAAQAALLYQQQGADAALAFMQAFDNTMKTAALMNIDVNTPEFVSDLTDTFDTAFDPATYDVAGFLAPFDPASQSASDLATSTGIMAEDMASAAEPSGVFSDNMVASAKAAQVGEFHLKGMKTTINEMASKVHVLQIKPEFVDIPSLFTMLLPNLLQWVQGNGGVVPGTDPRGSQTRPVVPVPR